MKARGRTIVVTGASSGIGREAARMLARQGARVWAVARSGDALQELADAQPGIVPLVADLATEAGRAATVAAAGPVDVLVNNAGIGWLGRVEDMPAGEVRRLFDINLIALIDMTQRVLPGMLERRRGVVVNVASVASWVAVPPLTVYSASKFAVQGFSEGLRREVAGRGVAVVTVNPGPVNTRFVTRARLDHTSTDEIGDASMPGVPVSMAARAVVRAVTRARIPGYATIAVPRALGVARLNAVPGARYLVDASAFAARRLGYRAFDL